MYCGNCGKEISEESKFCPYCGWKTDINEIAYQDVNQQGNYYAGISDQEEVYAAQSNGGNSNKRNIIIAIIVALLVIICVVVVGAVVLPAVLGNNGNVLADINKDFTNGRWVTLSHSEYDSNNNLTAWSENEVDEKGNITRITNYLLSKQNLEKIVRDYTIIEYDGMNRVLSEASFSKDDNMLSRYENKYVCDNEGRVTQCIKTIYNAKGEKSKTEAYSYKYEDCKVYELYQIPEFFGFSVKSKLTVSEYEETFKPGMANRLLEEVVYDGNTVNNSVWSNRKNTYDSQGRLVRTELKENGYNYTYEYDYLSFSERKVTEYINGNLKSISNETVSFFSNDNKNNS